MSKTSDLKVLLKVLTLRRVLNAAKVFFSYQYSRLINKPSQWGLPIAIAVEPTTSCNLRCPECPSGLRNFSRNTGMLQLDTFQNIVKKLWRETFYLTLYFQGEPYLNKQFFSFISFAKQHKLYTVTSTNAHYLNDENCKRTITSGLSRLIVSIDGTTQDTYQQYRIGGSLQKVLDGTKNMVKWKQKLKSSTPHIVFQYLVVKPNEHQIDEVKKLAKELGVDEVLFKTAQVYDYKNGNSLIPDNEKYSRYKKLKDGSYVIKNKLLNHCWKMWHSCVFTWDAKIVPCCFDKDATHQMGTLNEENDFKSIWFGAPYQKFRENLLKGRSKIDICTNCTEGTKVWA